MARLALMLVIVVGIIAMATAEETEHRHNSHGRSVFFIRRRPPPPPRPMSARAVCTPQHCYNARGKKDIHLPIEGRLHAKDGSATLLMQEDGNLALYCKGGKWYWQTKTNGKKIPKGAKFQPDGNLVLVDDKGKIAWASGSSGKGGVELTLQNDNNLVIYNKDNKAIWATNTAEKCTGNCPATGGVYCYNAMGTVNSHLKNGAILWAADKSTYLQMQTDGNLVLRCHKGHKVIWQIKKRAQNKRGARFQTNGDLALYDDKDKVYWRSKSDGKGGVTIMLKNDNDLVILDNKDDIIWHTKTTNKCK